MKEKLFGRIKLISNEVIKIHNILGIMYGPHSVTLKQYLRVQMLNNNVQRHKFDQWRYFTIITKHRTYDMILSSQEDALDLITALANAMSRYEMTEHTKIIETIK